MFVVSCRVQLALAGAQSLKDKRRLVKSLTERLRARYNASVSEVDDHDLWQRATLGFAVVSLRESDGRELVARMLRQVEAHDGVEVLAADIGVS